MREESTARICMTDVLRIHLRLLDTYRDILSSALDLHLSTVKPGGRS